jgi:hypothetical protein
MPQHKKLLIGYQVVPAGRARKCYHSQKHTIQKGDLVLEVRVGMGWKGYCLACAREMVQSAGSGLDELRTTIDARQLNRIGPIAVKNAEQQVT